MKSFKPLPAESAGLITNYRCTFRCKHCLYCSSPEVKETVEETTLIEIINQMDHTLGNIPVHIGGGEPLIHFDMIKKILSHLKNTGLALEYLETNGALLVRDTQSKLRQLQNAGLDRLLISISPFHNEFIELKSIRHIIHEVVSLFGQRGVFPWHPGYMPYLEKADVDNPVPLEKYFSLFSVREILFQLTSVMYIHPGGRGAYLLAKQLPLRPAEKLLEKMCTQNLGSPVHAHIDYQGNYLAGFCSGIRLGKQTGLDLNRLYGKGIDLSRYPLLDRLVNQGLKGLFSHTLKSGFEPDSRGYVSPCHLCLDMRLYLFSQDEPYEELHPRFFYKDLLMHKPPCPGP